MRRVTYHCLHLTRWVFDVHLIDWLISIITLISMAFFPSWQELRTSWLEAGVTINLNSLIVMEECQDISCVWWDSFYVDQRWVSVGLCRTLFRINFIRISIIRHILSLIYSFAILRFKSYGIWHEEWRLPPRN